MKMNSIQPAQLVIYDRTGVLKTIHINQQQVTIGREKPASTCDVLLSSELVSSVHGTIIFYNGEYYYIDDVSNVNGTFINGIKIKKEHGKPSLAQKLRDGDILSIGLTNISKEKTVFILFSTTTSDDYNWNALSISSIKEPITIGRDSRIVDILIPEATVSKKHAQITKETNGTIYIKDCRSVNGTLLNGCLIKPEFPTAFKERDIVTIGSFKIIHFGNVIIYNQINNSLQRKISNRSQSNSQKSIWVNSTPIPNDQNFSKDWSSMSNAHHYIKSGVELRVEHLSKIVPCKKGTGFNGGDKKYILDDVSLTIYPGELVAILGGSGAGKTTLMNAINGFEPATSGKVFINGNDLNKNYQAYKSQMGYVPQQDIVYDNLTMNDMLTFVAKLRLPGDYSKEEISHRVDDVLDVMALQKQKHTLIKKLSGGQKKRASIAVELISDPSLFFLDEPTSGLDPEAETNLMKQLKLLSSQKNKTTIVITHTLQNIHLFDKIIFMAPGGKLCFYGSPDEALRFFEVDNLADAYEKISEDTNKYVNKYKMKRQQT